MNDRYQRNRSFQSAVAIGGSVPIIALARHSALHRDVDGNARVVLAPRIAPAIQTNNGALTRREAAGRPARGPSGPAGVRQ